MEKNKQQAKKKNECVFNPVSTTNTFKLQHCCTVPRNIS
jgi:hypothetical protein